MNRETRRSYGDYVAVAKPSVPDYPRYMRRHILALLPGNALTRRVRKQRARIMRAYHRLGMWP